ncbi:MAG: ankyrin repeat domain-containing protein [Treponema sp.]|nr:ankyrin repeat domain-containing protein [Treponema sp.]
MTDTSQVQKYKNRSQPDEYFLHKPLIDCYRAVCSHDIATVQDFFDHHINPDSLLSNEDFALLKAEYKSFFDSEEQTTPLVTAVLCNDTAIAKLLIASGANVNLHTDFKYNAALLCACDTESRGYAGVEMAELLLDAGDDIEIRDEYDNTPLIEACYSDNAPHVKLLVSRGADVHARKYRQETPFTVAAQSVSAETARCLLAHGADIHDCNEDRESVFLLAERNNSPEIVPFLRSYLG